MTRSEKLKTIIKAVINGHYTEEDFGVFKSEYGWSDWMNEFTEAADDEEISAAEERAIDEILEEGFKMAFDPFSVELYLNDKK